MHKICLRNGHMSSSSLAVPPKVALTFHFFIRSIKWVSVLPHLVSLVSERDAALSSRKYFNLGVLPKTLVIDSPQFFNLLAQPRRLAVTSSRHFTTLCSRLELFVVS